MSAWSVRPAYISLNRSGRSRRSLQALRPAMGTLACLTPGGNSLGSRTGQARRTLFTETPFQ